MIVNRKEAVGAGGWSIVNGNKRSIQSYFMARTRIKDGEKVWQEHRGDGK